MTRSGYPTAIVPVDDLALFDGAGWISGVRCHVEISGAGAADWYCFDVEATDGRGHWFRIPESSPFRSFILAQLNGPQRSVVADAISDAQALHFPDDEAPCAYQSTGRSNPLSPVVL